MSHKTAATVAHTIGIDTGKNTLHLIGLDIGHVDGAFSQETQR